MAKQKYSKFADALDAAATLDGTEPVVIIQDGLPVQTTTQDIADLGGGGAASYSVYTALLTQTTPDTYTSGTLVVGETYTLTTFAAGDDFTNVADVQSGTINTNGCVFIATGTTPTDWTNGSTLDSAGNPIATVLENTLGGAVVWTRQETGIYAGTLEGVFIDLKTAALIGNTNAAFSNAYRYSDDAVQVVTNDNTLNAADGYLNKTPIEIRVYP